VLEASPSTEHTIGHCKTDSVSFFYHKTANIVVMTLDEYYIVYPDGDSQELEGPLRIDQLVDLNGRPLYPPLPTARMIAYRVVKVLHKEDRGIHAVLHFVELVPAAELAGLTSRP